MTIIEKIKAEIERLEEEAREVRVSKEKPLNEKIGADGKVNLCRDILSFLNTLEEKSEIPINLDLKEDALMYCFDNGINLSTRAAEEFARHFYELGRNAK